MIRRYQKILLEGGIAFSIYFQLNLKYFVILSILSRSVKYFRTRNAEIVGITRTYIFFASLEFPLFINHFLFERISVS